MSKTIQIEVISPNHAYFPGDRVKIDVSNFCAVARQLATEVVDFDNGVCGIPQPWFAAALFAVDSKGAVELTPRGEDLLASAHIIPEDSMHEPKGSGERMLCSSCNGGGTETLFAYAKPCPHCEGSTFEPGVIIRNESNDECGDGWSRAVEVTFDDEGRVRWQTGIPG